MRPDLAPPPVTAAAAASMATFNADTVALVRETVAAHPVVVVGMAWNTAVKRARAALTEAGIAHHYLELGNYTNQWRRRLAVKLWSGWPTFPQVYVRGSLIGGADHTQAALADGTLRALLDATGRSAVSDQGSASPVS